MTLAEAVEAIEAGFIVHEEAGYASPWTDQDGEIVADGARDMTLAPNGEPYITMTSYGDSLSYLPALFASESLAVEWWRDEVMAYAAAVRGKHLYWREKPRFCSATYLAMGQAELLQTQSPLAAILQIELGFVQAMLLISKLGPDGKED